MRDNYAQPTPAELCGAQVAIAMAKRKLVEGDIGGAVRMLLAVLEANTEILRPPDHFPRT